MLENGRELQDIMKTSGHGIGGFLKQITERLAHSSKVALSTSRNLSLLIGEVMVSIVGFSGENLVGVNTVMISSFLNSVLDKK